MTFWGVLLKPNEPYTPQWDGSPKRLLRISQATLAPRCGLWNSRSVVQCAVGSKPPVLICSLSMKESSSCQLDLLFEESDDVVFSVRGPRGVHLSGYFLTADAHIPPATVEPQGVEGEDIWETESDNFSDDGYEENGYDLNDRFIDDEDLQIPPATQEFVEDGAFLQEFISDENKGGAGIGGMTVDSSDRYTEQKGAHNEVGFGNNEELINEKTSDHSKYLDKIPAVGCIIGGNQCIDDIAELGEENRSLLQKCNLQVSKVDVGLGEAGNLNNSGSERLLLPDNVLNGNQDQAMVSNETELLKGNGNNTSSSVTPTEKIKEVEVAEGSIGKANFDLPDGSLESHIKLHKGSLHNVAGNGYTITNSKSKKEKKKKNNDMDLDKYIIQAREPFVQKYDQYIIEERKKISKEKSTVGSAKKEEKAHRKSNGNKRKRDTQDGNLKGGDLGSEFAINPMEAGTGCGAEDHRSKTFCESVEDKNKSLNGGRNGRKQRQTEMLDDNIELVADSSVSQRKKLKKVRVEDGTFRKEDLVLLDKASESQSILQKDDYENPLSRNLLSDAGNTFTLGHSKKNEKFYKKSNSKDSKGQVSSLSVSQKKKKKKVKVGEGTLGEKDLDPLDHAVVSQSKLPHERALADAGYAQKRSHSKEMKKKKKSQNLGRKRKNEKKEVARDEAIDGTAKKKGKSHKKLDVKDIEVHDGNVKGVDSGFEFAMDSMEVEARGGECYDKTFTKVIEDDGTFIVDRGSDREDVQNEKATNNIEQVSVLSVSQKKKKKKVRVGEGTLKEKDLYRSDHALLSQSKLPNERPHADAGCAHKRSHSKEMKEKKKKNHNLDDDKHLGKKRKNAKKEVARVEAIDGSAEKKEKICKKLDVKDIKGDAQDGNAKGVDRVFEFAMDSMEVEARGGECYGKTFKEVFEDDDTVLVSSSSDRKERQKETATDNIEKVSGLSVCQKKKKKKARVGESTPQEKDLNPPDHALLLQSKLPNEGVVAHFFLRRRPLANAGCAHKRSHCKEMKENKKKNHNLDDDKHLGEKRKNEKNEVARQEAIHGSSKKKGKSYKKMDVKDIKGDAQDGNAKGVERGFEFAMDSVEVKARGGESYDKTFKKVTEDDDAFLVGSSSDRKERQKESATDIIESVLMHYESHSVPVPSTIYGGGNDMELKKSKKKETTESKLPPHNVEETRYTDNNDVTYECGGSQNCDNPQFGDVSMLEGEEPLMKTKLQAQEKSKENMGNSCQILIALPAVSNPTSILQASD